MAPPRFKADYKGIGQAMRSDGIRGELRKEAERIAAKAKSIAQAEGVPGFAASIRVEEGTRPPGRGQQRPYAQVIGDHADGAAIEYGAQGVDKLRVLGRAAGVEVRD